MLILSLNENFPIFAMYIFATMSSKNGEMHVNYYVRRQQKNMAIQYTINLLLIKKSFWYIQYDAHCM